jgi:hypothetical protein
VCLDVAVWKKATVDFAFFDPVYRFELKLSGSPDRKLKVLPPIEWPHAHIIPNNSLFLA